MSIQPSTIYYLDHKIPDHFYNIKTQNSALWKQIENIQKFIVDDIINYRYSDPNDLKKVYHRYTQAISIVQITNSNEIPSQSWIEPIEYSNQTNNRKCFVDLNQNIKTKTILRCTEISNAYENVVYRKARKYHVSVKKLAEIVPIKLSNLGLTFKELSKGITSLKQSDPDLSTKLSNLKKYCIGNEISYKREDNGSYESTKAIMIVANTIHISKLTYCWITPLPTTPSAIGKPDFSNLDKRTFNPFYDLLLSKQPKGMDLTFKDIMELCTNSRFISQSGNCTTEQSIWITVEEFKELVD